MCRIYCRWMRSPTSLASSLAASAPKFYEWQYDVVRFVAPKISVGAAALVAIVNNGRAWSMSNRRCIGTRYTSKESPPAVHEIPTPLINTREYPPRARASRISILPNEFGRIYALSRKYHEIGLCAVNTYGRDIYNIFEYIVALWLSFFFFFFSIDLPYSPTF